VVEPAAKIRPPGLTVRGHVDFAQGKFLIRAGVTFAARHGQVHLADGGIGVRRRQDFMIAMAAGAIGGERLGAVFSREAMIAAEKSFHAVSREVVFGVQPLRGMAAAANVLRDGPGRTALEGADFMFIVTAGAGGGVHGPGDHSLAMNTDLPVASLLVMARAASLGLTHKIDRRGGGAVGNDFVRIMAVAARRRIVMPGAQRLAMNARIKTIRLAGVTKPAVDRFDRLVVVRMPNGDIGMASDAGVGLMRGQLQFGRIHKERDSLAGGIGFDQRVIAVAIEAIAIIQTGEGRHRQEQGEQQKETAIHA